MLKGQGVPVLERARQLGYGPWHGVLNALTFQNLFQNLKGTINFQEWVKALKD